MGSLLSIQSNLWVTLWVTLPNPWAIEANPWIGLTLYLVELFKQNPFSVLPLLRFKYVKPSANYWGSTKFSRFLQKSRICRISTKPFIIFCHVHRKVVDPIQSNNTWAENVLPNKSPGLANPLHPPYYVSCS